MEEGRRIQRIIVVVAASQGFVAFNASAHEHVENHGSTLATVGLAIKAAALELLKQPKHTKNKPLPIPPAHGSLHEGVPML